MFGATRKNVPRIMRTLALLATIATLTAAAQYGSFDPKAISAAQANTTLVVLDDANTGYNAAISDAMKGEWKFTSSLEFINTKELATQPLDPTKNYLMRIKRTDAEKHDGVFLALVAGWKQKKGEALVVEDDAVTNLPASQELASIMIDPKVVSTSKTAMLKLYVKHFQDFLTNVEKGKIKDKATADRLYQNRTHLIKDMELWIAKEQLDKSVPDAKKATETYTHALQVMDMDQLMAAAASSKDGVAIGDVIITGTEKTKWCFKRVFNANTGELMYLRDDAALYGKKEGFISEDLRMIEQSR